MTSGFFDSMIDYKMSEKQWYSKLVVFLLAFFESFDVCNFCTFLCDTTQNAIFNKTSEQFIYWSNDIVFANMSKFGK